MTALYMQLTGWSAWEGDALHYVSLSPTKRDMLIGYDLMPLRGLRKTEAHLKRHGIVIVRTVVRKCDPQARQGFCLSCNGRLERESLSWSITHCGGGVWGVEDSQGHEALSFYSSCSFVLSRWKDALSEAEKLTLGYLGWYPVKHDDPSQPKDGRNRATLRKAMDDSRAVFARLNLEIVPVTFSKVSHA